MKASTTEAMRHGVEELEAGGIFRHLKITNFLEGDLFAWYLSEWSPAIEKTVRDLVTRLDDYNPGTLSENPTDSRDLLKNLYQQLFPKQVRHDLGEYYTPDWLAEHLMDQVNYSGDPSARMLDPACGSGTFLVMAIARARRWFEVNREACGFDEQGFCGRLLTNIIGFDLNPLAVMAARTNYLIAIRDLIQHVDKVEIPVYLCDSIVTPTEYGDLFTGRLGAVRQFKTVAAEFLVPEEIASRWQDINTYAEELERCIRNKYSGAEFLDRCRSLELPVEQESLHLQLYDQLQLLQKANKNGIWARIIKNSFAPLFIGEVDFVIGNPPWVRWGYLPQDYRDATAHLWKEYGLFSLKGHEARLGSGEKDLSQLFTYVCIDRYLRDKGHLGFLITQTVFKAKGQAEGFRRFRIGDTGAFFSIDRVDDLSRVSAFEAANLTACFVATKGERTGYPVPYFLWLPKEAGPLYQLTQLKDVLVKVEILPQKARPSGASPRSQWQTASGRATGALSKITGAGKYSVC